MRLLERTDRTETMVYGRNSSVTNGRTRFIGEDSLIVMGSQLVSGVLRVIGRVVVEGLGILSVNGMIELFGNLRVRAGGNIDVDSGEITSGNVRIADGKVHVGSMVLDPTLAGGAVTFPNGAQVFTDGTTIQVYKGNSVVQISDGAAQLQHGGTVIEINGSGARISRSAVAPIDGVGLPTGALFQDANGYLRRSTGP